MTKQIGERISSLRKQHNMSQDELASEINVSRQAISNWERGEALPEISNLLAISKVLNVSLDYLVDGVKPSILNEKSNIEQPTVSKNEKLDDKNGTAITESTTVKKERYYTVTTKKRVFNPHYSDKVVGFFAVISLIIFLMLGYIWNMWHPGWLVFLLIPAVSALVERETPHDKIMKEKNYSYNRTVKLGGRFAGFTAIMATMIYLFVGFEADVWHPTWIVFLFVPAVAAATSNKATIETSYKTKARNNQK